MFSKRGILISALVLILSGSAFSYRILVGRFKDFPYHDLREVWFSAVENFGDSIAGPVEEVASSGEGDFSVETEWIDLEGDKYNITGQDNLHGRGGGLTKIVDKIIGVDSKGRLFIYDVGGKIKDSKTRV